MLEDRFKDDVILKVATGVIVDGMESTADHAGKAMIMDFSYRDVNYFGQIKNGKKLLRCRRHHLKLLPNFSNFF